MKKFLTRSLLLILFITGGIGNAFADYWEAGSYNGPFQFTRTVLSLDTTWIGWRFANYNYDGIDDELRYSRWYVGGNKAGWETYRTKPSEYFYTPFWQGKEILYLERGHGITQRQNEEYGVGDITAKKVEDDIHEIESHEMIFYPGELMGPEEMKYFYIRVTGFWDIDSDDGDGHWMGQGESSLGNAADGATWQGPGVRHRGNGVARYAQVKYNIPGTDVAKFTRRPGGKIEVSINGNDHDKWNEFYGFSNSAATDEHGYYINNYGTVKLNDGKGTYTLDSIFDETEDVVIYYHQYYKRSQTISGQIAPHENGRTETKTVNQHFQAPVISTTVKGYIYPENLQFTPNKWNNSVKLEWDKTDKDRNTDGGWLIFRQKKGETGYELLTSSRLSYQNKSYTDTEIETGAEYTYYVTFAPNVYGDINAPIESRLTSSITVTHDNTFKFSDVNAELSNGTTGGILLSWTPERASNDVTFFVQRWNEESRMWENLEKNGQTETSYLDKENLLPFKEYRYRIKTSYWGLDFYSEEKNICYAVMTTITDFAASQGTYSNMVKLNWNVSVLSSGDTRYVISRKLLGDPQAVFTKVYEMAGKESSYFYEDMSAQPGQFYDYKVTAFAYVNATDTTEAKWIEGNSKETDGFVQTRGIVSGRIKYDTGTAVQGAKVLLSKSDNNDHSSKQFYSLYFNGEGKDGIEWRASDEVTKNYLSGNRPWSVQMYVRPENGMTGTQPIFDVNGYAGVAVSPATDGYELHVNSATGGQAATYSETGIVIPEDAYTHIVFSYDGASTYTLRTIVPDTHNIEFVEGKQMKTFTGRDNVKFEDETRPRTLTFGKSGFKGYVDEIRVWTKVLSDKEIINCHDRVLTCTEANLLCYWQLDEGINGLRNVYDYSKTNGIANGNHAAIKGNALISEVVPTVEQLSLYGLTDEHGNYVIRGVPFSGDGTTYIVRPVMGIHEFSPGYHTRYVSNNSLTHSDVSFDDVSSFPVSGVVYYENTTYPVQGCYLYVDDYICTMEGKLVETDEYGRFEISVPIGEHYIKIEKNGHTFVNEGRYPTGVGTRYTFEQPMSNLTFYDNTLVHITGRVVGGDIEGNKALGNGLSNNNIGVAQLVLTPTNDIYSLNVTQKVNGTVVSYENNTEVLPAASASDKINSNSWRGSGDNAGRIYINTDAETGEFSAMVPPLVYNVSAPTIIKTNRTIGTAGLADSSNPLLEICDTLTNDSSEEQLFKYHCKYNYTYHSAPTFTVTQSNLENGKFGIEEIEITDEAGEFTVDIINEDGSYTYGVPFFIQNDPYTFKLKGYEQYTNYDSGKEVTTTVPLKDCVVTISNALSDGQPIVVELTENSDEDLQVGDVLELESNQLKLDENGEATYRWQAGLANTTPPYSRTISMTYEVGGEVIPCKFEGKEFMEGIILGALPTGNNFVTMGPDKVLMVLRDPPGSKSSAKWTSGTVTALDWLFGGGVQEKSTNKTKTKGGWDIVTSKGTPAASVTNVTNTTSDKITGLSQSIKGEASNKWSNSITVTEAISTSSDRNLVGTKGDVFIGQSTNIVFGKANEVGFTRDVNGNITLGVQEIIATGNTFETFFTYSVFYIESFLLPNLESLRNNLLITLSPEDYANYENNSDGLKFITMLSPDDPRYGSNNHDKDVWGEEAVVLGKLEGPSYKVVLPERLLVEKDYRIDETVQADQDSIYMYNLQMSNWKRHLAANEEEKIKAWENREEKLFKNYSFEGGTDVNYSYSTDSATIFNWQMAIGVNGIIGGKDGGTRDGVGFENDWEIEAGGFLKADKLATNKESASFSYTLSDDVFDALSVDVYKSPMGYIFRTRAGQTSAPYEGEEYTQYYQPGKHKIHEGTMQLEVPDIEVENATVTNLPSGSAASFTMLLSNKSEVDIDMLYSLMLIEETNPKGAQISVDGTPLSVGRTIKVPAGQTVKKTLLLKQSNQGILDYENIGIALVSRTQGDPTGVYPVISDTAYISAHYVPSSSPVKMELNRTLLNTSSGTDLEIKFNSFDRNYYNLKAFRIQYMKQGDTDWTLLKEYLVNAEEGQQLSQTQAILPETADVTYTLDMSSFADGKYTFRVLSASTYGTGESTLVTDAIEVTKDMARPMVFGTPKPTTGLLGTGDDIELTFNENINSGRLTSTGNFLVTAALNGAAVAHDIALLASGTEGAVAKTEANINLIGKSFAVDMWVRISGEGTIFSHGNGSNKLALGIKKKIDGEYYFTVNGEVYGNPLPADKWIYLAFNLDQEYFDGPCFTALYADDASSEYLAVEKPIERYEGNGAVALGDGFTGAIHEVALWDEAINVTTLQAQMHETKKPTTEHLIGYWKFNEGNGTQAKDLARNRHMNIGSTSWYMNNKNKSLDLVDGLYGENDAFVINLSESPVRTGDDHAIELWFRADAEQDGAVAYIFDSDAFGVALENGKMRMYSSGSSEISGESRLIMSMGNKSYNDGKWHHLAINVLRNGNTVAYVDGEAVGQVASTTVPALQTVWLHLGAQCYRATTSWLDVIKNKMKGEIDEIRVWNATLNANVIRDRMNRRLEGNEPGLIAYYPFEEEQLDANSQIVTMGTPVDMVTRKHEVTARKAEEHTVAFTDEAPALKPAGNETNINYDFIASDRGIVIELNEEADRLEGVTVNITVKDVLDLNGNKSLPVTWTALVKRNQLIWAENNIDVAGRIGEEKKFTATVTNQSAQSEHWVLGDLPSWLSANFTSGSLPALGSQEITFTVDASAPTGKSEFTVYMSGNNAIPVPLTVNMNLKADAPDWSVEPSDYEGSATLFGAVKINVDGKIVYSEDEDDLVAAFIDGKCVGVTNVQYEDFSDSYRVYLNISGHSDDAGKPIELKVWDASTGLVHPVVKTFADSNADVELEEGVALQYEENATLGDYDNTYTVYATNYIQQSTPLKKNWNWISVYVNNKESGNAINSVLESINPNGIIIKNVSAHSEYITRANKWVTGETEGNINHISSRSMYKLHMNAADILVVNGEQEEGQNIEIHKGWNWIPYTRSFTMSLDDAFAATEPARNDQIKGQEGYAMYNGTAWNGTLTSLTPGKGYLYKHSSDKGTSISYPSQRNVAAAAMAPARRFEAERLFAPVDPSEYESNMTVLAVVKKGDELIENVQEIAVFDGAVCLATTTVESDGFFYLTIPGDKSVTSRLTIVAVEDGNIVETATSLYFSEDATFGNYDEPFEVSLGHPTAIGKMLAEGNCERMQVVDLSGRVYYTGTTAGFDINNLNDGQYIFEFFTNEGQVICYKQLIRRVTE